MIPLKRNRTAVESFLDVRGGFTFDRWQYFHFHALNGPFDITVLSGLAWRYSQVVSGFDSKEFPLI
ncbi:MAG: hypothetical protein ACFFD4_18695 [Candidatus Odinarchaeota archaeon]